MATAGYDSPSEYELKRLENINKNFEFMEKCGFKVNKKALIPKPRNRKPKVESDSSDEEWLPGVDEEGAFYERKKFKPIFKPKKLPIQRMHRTTKQSTSQAKQSANKINEEKTGEQDRSDFELLGKFDDHTINGQLGKETKAVKKSIKFRCKKIAEKQSPRVTRSIRKCYNEEEVPDDDRYFFCEECQDFYYGECPLHNFIIIEDCNSEMETMHPDAVKSLPESLSIQKSLIPGAGLGVFSKVKLDVNTRFGPYRGSKVDLEDLEDEMNTDYMWEIVQDGKMQHYIDGFNTSCSNWMRFVNCSRCESEQNLVAYQYHGEIYYRAYKRIEPNTELLVWYGDEYAEQLGIPLLEEEQCEDDVGGYSCKYCGRMYAYHNYLEVHLKRCPVLARAELWECKNCSRKYITEEYLNMHMENDCNKNVSLKNDRPKQNCKSYQCQHCEKYFTNNSKLKEHQRTHTGVKPYQCEHCGKRFTVNSNLNLHLRTHTGVKPYQCEHCGKRFTQNGHLNKHLRTHTV